jgi:metal-dependent amidase/aminoacylase/carboxypeptidase family protein
MDREALKKQACVTIDDMSDALISASRAIHSKPELAFEEHFAHGLLTDRVEEAGLPVERGACGLDTAFISSFGDTGVEVGILSEYDALPGIGHACGHNIIDYYYACKYNCWFFNRSVSTRYGFINSC